MEKDRSEMSQDELNAWHDSLSKPEQLEEARKLRAELWEKYGDDEAEVTPEEYANLDETIDFLDIAIRVEAATRIEDIKQLPEADAIQIMHDWFLAQCDKGRPALDEMGIDVETVKRWSRMLIKRGSEAREKLKDARRRGLKPTRLWRVERYYDPEPDNQLATEVKDANDLRPFTPSPDQHDKN